MRTNTLFWIFLFFLCCCTKKEVRDVEIVNIEIKKYEVDNIYADSLFSSVEYRILELTPESVISKIHKIELDEENNVWILDRKLDIILIFDESGAFKGKLDKKGRGPEEYINLEDFFLINNLLYCLVSGNDGIQVYDIEKNMEHVEFIPLDTQYSEMILLEDNTLFLNNDFSSLGYLITVYDFTQREMIGKIKKYPDAQYGVGSAERMFYKFENELYSTFSYEYSLYKIAMEGEKELVQYDFGKRYMFPTYLKDVSFMERDKYRKGLGTPADWPVWNISHPVITNSHYICSFVANVSPYTLFQDRETGTLLYGYIFNTATYPLVTPSFHHYTKDKLIQVIDTDFISSLSKSDSFKENIPEHLKTLDIEANPVLGFYELKEKYR